MDYITGYPISPHERSLLTAATEMVTDWQGAQSGGSFRRAVLTQADHYLTLHGLTHADYAQFRLMANAIRTGKGDPNTNPDPLIAILRGEADQPVSW